MPPFQYHNLRPRIQRGMLTVHCRRLLLSAICLSSATISLSVGSVTVAAIVRFPPVSPSCSPFHSVSESRAIIPSASVVASACWGAHCGFDMNGGGLSRRDGVGDLTGGECDHGKSPKDSQNIPACWQCLVSRGGTRRDGPSGGCPRWDLDQFRPFRTRI